MLTLQGASRVDVRRRARADIELLSIGPRPRRRLLLRSGEAELAGIVMGAAEGPRLVAIARDLGFSTFLQVCAGSSATI
eukprot:8247281-Alexandrium_andersonii.AAC.1